MRDKADTYCGKCIKADVCGMEGVYDPATTYCVYRVEARPHETLESAIDYLTEIGWLPEHDRILTETRPHGECNQCRYYDGVHGVQGHAPCWHWNIGGVMWNDYCSRFEKAGEAE